MTEIKQTLYTIAVISVTAGVLEMFTRSTTLKKYTKYAVSLVITLSLLYPMISLGENLPNNLKGIEFPQKTTTTPQDDYLISALKHSLQEEISTYFKIPINVFETDVTATAYPNEVLIDLIHIKIKDKNYYRYTERIEYYLKSNFGCQIKVTAEEKE